VDGVEHRSGEWRDRRERVPRDCFISILSAGIAPVIAIVIGTIDRPRHQGENRNRRKGKGRGRGEGRGKGKERKGGRGGRREKGERYPI
jgi:hypothetical protein